MREYETCFVFLPILIGVILLYQLIELQFFTHFPQTMFSVGAWDKDVPNSAITFKVQRDRLSFSFSINFLFYFH